jgi:hypothetical protein
VGRTLVLTALAPGIVEAILAGNEPDGVSPTKLHKGLPVYWQRQRAWWRCRRRNPTGAVAIQART